MNIFFVILTYAIWSSTFSIGKWTLQYASPLFLTSSRMLLAAALLLLYLFFRKRASFALTKKQILPLFLLGLFSIYLSNAFEFWGLQHLSAGKACFIYSLSPFFAALFSYLHFGEKMNSRKWLGMGIGFLGILPVLYSKTGGEDLLGGLGILSWADLSLIAAALCGIYGWVLLRLVVKDKEISPIKANGWSMLFGGSLALIHSLLVDSWTPLPLTKGSSLPFLEGIFILTLTSNILCYNLYGWLLKKFTATFMSFLGLLSPIFASFHAWIFLNEKPSFLIFGCTAIVSLGLWIVYHAELKQGYIIKKKKSEPTLEMSS